MAIDPPTNVTASQERVLSKRAELEAELDRLIRTARAGGNTAAGRSLVLSSVDLLLELDRAARSEAAGRIVAEYQAMARQRAEAGHA